MHHALDEPIPFKAAQSLGEHLLRNPADLALKRGIPHRAASKNLDDERCPFVRDAIQHESGWTARIEHRRT